MENIKSCVTDKKTDLILERGASTQTPPSKDEIPQGVDLPNASENPKGSVAETKDQQKPPPRRMPHLHKLEKKHSSGDLHSRLKTRKLLGVGETDDGDVHRSKLSQILGHSDQLYVRLPPGLRIWHVVVATIFSALALWAFIFPAHLFDLTFESEEGKFLRLPVRLYGIALICISLIFWYTLNTVDKDVIRMMLMCTVIFFTLQTIVMMLTVVSEGTITRGWLTCMGLQIVIAAVSYLYLWALGGRLVALKRCGSNKELCEKEQ